MFYVQASKYNICMYCFISSMANNRPIISALIIFQTSITFELFSFCLFCWRTQSLCLPSPLLDCHYHFISFVRLISQYVWRLTSMYIDLNVAFRWRMNTDQVIFNISLELERRATKYKAIITAITATTLLLPYKNWHYYRLMSLYLARVVVGRVATQRHIDCSSFLMNISCAKFQNQMT